MDTRDYFAGLAMQAFIIKSKRRHFAFEGKQLAQASFDAADWMMKRRTEIIQATPKPQPTP